MNDVARMFQIANIKSDFQCAAILVFGKFTLRNFGNIILHSGLILIQLFILWL